MLLLLLLPLAAVLTGELAELASCDDDGDDEGDDGAVSWRPPSVVIARSPPLDARPPDSRFGSPVISDGGDDEGFVAITALVWPSPALATVSAVP